MAFKLGDSRGNPIQNAKNPNHNLLGGDKSGNGGKVLTYKENKDYFDNRAVYHPNAKYNDQIRKRVYSGKYGYNPDTGALTKLKPTEQKKISEDEKKYLEKTKYERPRQYYSDGTPVDMTKEELEEYGRAGTKLALDTGSEIIRNIPGVETISDVLDLGTAAIKGDVEGMSYATAGLLSPLSGRTIKKLSKLKHKIDPPVTKKQTFMDKPTSYSNDPFHPEARDISESSLIELKSRGQKLDTDHGYFDYSQLGPENVKLHGTKAGRTMVEVEMPDGNTQLFYKSTDLSGKGVEGYWQPYGGHMDAPGDWFVDEVEDKFGNITKVKRPREKVTKDWFIKDAGFEDFYNSDAYRETAGQLDRISHEGGWDMSQQILASELKARKVQPHK